MTGVARSLLGCGPDDPRVLEIDDYAGELARWCSGCGDHSVLAAVKRLLADERLRPEKIVFVSGSGCASRLPHYVATYGFQGIHGRALPVATGIKLSRPDLSVFAVMGDGDCCSIGAAHWLHAIRTNSNMVALLLDNAVYGITGSQSSPTTPRGHATHTNPRGVRLPPLNPLAVTLGVTNVSFVAQTADWIPAHLYQTLRMACRHRGFSFVRVLQRCPKFSEPVFEEEARKPFATELLVHEEGIDPPGLESLYQNRTRHDPADFEQGRRLAEASGDVRIGLFFRDQSRPCYDDLVRPRSYTPDEKIERLNAELDRHAV